MDEFEYIEKRLQDQIDWYDRKSISAQKWFKRLRTFEFIAAAAIPLISGFSTLLEYQPQLPLLVGSLGFLVTVVAGLMGLNQFQERWVEYRTSCEALKREKYLYLAHAYPYDGERQFPLLVQNVEGLLAKETSAWGQYMRAAGKPKPAPAGEERVSVEESPTPPPEAASEAGVSNASSSTLDQVQDAIVVVKGVAGVLLPGEVGGKVAEIATAAEKGVVIFKEATEVGVASAAATAVAEVMGSSGAESPLKAIVEKALGSFGPVLGTAVPPIGLVLAVGTVAIKLGRDAYGKWKARILHLPFSPASGPLLVVDANTGFSLFQQSPTFAEAFSKAMGDRKFLKEAAIDFVQKTNVDTLWQTYERRGQFESRQEFEKGLQEFRRAAADAELQNVVDPSWVSEAGGYQEMLSHVDALQRDPEARTDLAALVDTVEKMQANNEPVLDRLAEIKKEHT